MRGDPPRFLADEAILQGVLPAHKVGNSKPILLGILVPILTEPLIEKGGEWEAKFLKLLEIETEVCVLEVTNLCGLIRRVIREEIEASRSK
jgi:hypothetical protein